MTDRVLLTGISGFLGGHVALQLLNAGYAVRGSVRNLDKADKVRSALGKAGADVARVEFVALDLMSDAGWAEAMAGCRYLQHVASPFVTRMPQDKMDLIRPAVEGTQRALQAALDGDVERMVLTSSMAAIMYGHGADRRAPFGPEDWTRLDSREVNAYVESKTLAERKAWEIVDAAGRHHDLAVVNPSAILGPLLDDDPGTSVAMVSRMLDGSVPAAPRISFGIVDVRDVAALHVAAMTGAEAGGRRFPMAAGTESMLQLARVLRAALPERSGKLPRFELPDWIVRLYAMFDADVRGNLGELGIVKFIDASAAMDLLGRALISAEEAAVASGQSLVARGLV